MYMDVEGIAGLPKRMGVNLDFMVCFPFCVFETALQETEEEMEGKLHWN